MFTDEERPSRTAPIDRNRELLKHAREEIYKTVGGLNLSAYIWTPEQERMPDYPLSVIAFFYSSSWDNGQVTQFAPHCMYFASRGMLAVAFDYRVNSRHGSTPLHAMADARSAMRWLRLNALELGINPGKIVGAGGSGGAHIVGASAFLLGFDEPGEDTSISTAPNAMVLFNPIVDTYKKGYGMDRFPNADYAKQSSLMNAIDKNLPPSVVFHGTADRVIPITQTENFVRKMKRKKNRCELITYEGAGHGFFNFNVSFALYQGTLSVIDQFLVEEGFIEADPDALTFAY